MDYKEAFWKIAESFFQNIQQQGDGTYSGIKEIGEEILKCIAELEEMGLEIYEKAINIQMARFFEELIVDEKTEREINEEYQKVVDRMTVGFAAEKLKKNK